MSLRDTIEKHVNRFGIWGTAIGIVWGGMTWVASFVTPLAGYGWGTFVFAGLGAACVLSLVLSAALIAWRYFNPLSQSGISATTGATNNALSPVDISSLIVRGGKTLINTLDAIQRTLFLLSARAVDQMHIEMFEGAIRAFPFFEDVPLEQLASDQMKAQIKKIHTSVQEVLGVLGTSRWRPELAREIESVERLADDNLRDVNTPSTLHWVDLRAYWIATQQQKIVRNFLQRALEELRGQQSQMLQMLYERKREHERPWDR